MCVEYFNNIQIIKETERIIHTTKKTKQNKNNNNNNKLSTKQNFYLNLLSTNQTKWSNTLKQFAGFCRQIL